jgi:hypothetical protein
MQEPACTVVGGPKDFYHIGIFSFFCASKEAQHVLISGGYAGSL